MSEFASLQRDLVGVRLCLGGCSEIATASFRRLLDDMCVCGLVSRLVDDDVVWEETRVDQS